MSDELESLLDAKQEIASQQSAVDRMLNAYQAIHTDSAINPDEIAVSTDGPANKITLWFDHE